MSVGGNAQVPEPRVVAAAGHPASAKKGLPVWETWIAAGESEVISVYHVGTGERIGYALHDSAGGDWTDFGIIADGGSGGVNGAVDPSIAYLGPDSDTFLACSMVAQSGSRAIGVSRFANGDWDSWEPLTDFIFGPFGYDKPWILAGGAYEGERELYITFWRTTGGGRHSYLRSMDGGETWTLGDITFGLGGEVVEMGAANYQPAVAGGGPLYLAYTPVADLREIRFVCGRDIDDPNDPDFGEIEFSALPGCDSYESLGDDPVPSVLELVVTRNRTTFEIPDMLPGGDVRMDFQSIPWLAADPNDPNQLYLVYHDTATADSNDLDVNVYCQKLRFQLGGWCAGDRVTVNDGDDQNYEVDQFMPSVTVDDAGRVHILYYDDRRYNVDSDQNEGTVYPRVDVYYTYSNNGGGFFQSGAELTKDPNGADPNETCLDYDLLDGFNFPYKPGDYNGIAAYGGTVWTAFTGTSLDELDGDPQSNPSVIWACRIPF